MQFEPAYYRDLASFLPRLGFTLGPADQENTGMNFKYCDGTLDKVLIQSLKLVNETCEDDVEPTTFRISDFTKEMFLQSASMATYNSEFDRTGTIVAFFTDETGATGALFDLNEAAYMEGVQSLAIDGSLASVKFDANAFLAENYTIDTKSIVIPDPSKAKMIGFEVETVIFPGCPAIKNKGDIPPLSDFTIASLQELRSATCKP